MSKKVIAIAFAAASIFVSQISSTEAGFRKKGRHRHASESVSSCGGVSYAGSASVGGGCCGGESYGGANMGGPSYAPSHDQTMYGHSNPAHSGQHYYAPTQGVQSQSGDVNSRLNNGPVNADIQSRVTPSNPQVQGNINAQGNISGGSSNSGVGGSVNAGAATNSQVPPLPVPQQ